MPAARTTALGRQRRPATRVALPRLNIELTQRNNIDEEVDTVL
jgi:hypothetical protein